jgi:hypothetical protein
LQAEIAVVLHSVDKQLARDMKKNSSVGSLRIDRITTLATEDSRFTKGLIWAEDIDGDLFAITVHAIQPDPPFADKAEGVRRVAQRENLLILVVGMALAPLYEIAQRLVIQLRKQGGHAQGICRHHGGLDPNQDVCSNAGLHIMTSPS